MAVAATGFFDGVHLGHRKVIEKVRDIAQTKGQDGVIVTFWPHPLHVVSGGKDSPKLLTTLEEKQILFNTYGADKVSVLDFDLPFSRMSAAEFIRDYLVNRVGVSTLVVGFDHRMGHDTFRSTQELADLVRSFGIEPVIVDQYCTESGIPVSSTAIRKYLAEGNVTAAWDLLGYRYRLEGRLLDGSTFVPMHPFKALPADGEYKVEAKASDFRVNAVCRINGGSLYVDAPKLRELAVDCRMVLKFER